MIEVSSKLDAIAYFSVPLLLEGLLQRLQALQAEGLSLQKIADRLNNEGIPTLSGKGKWQKGTIGNLLAQAE